MTDESLPAGETDVTPKPAVDLIAPEHPEGEPLPGGSFASLLAWDSEPVDVHLAVELPFWLMVGNCPLDVTSHGWSVTVQIRDNFFEVHGPDYFDSKLACLYLGPNPSQIDPRIIQEADRNGYPIVARKCKTVLRIPARCLQDAIDASADGYWRRLACQTYLAALATAHIPLVNAVIRRYRLATYDYLPYEVSPWDVPVWFLQASSLVQVPVHPAGTWDYKPMVNSSSLVLATLTELQNGRVDPEPGELELLDGMMLMERGDYSGAVRRAVTALEVLVEAQLRTLLAGQHEAAEVERRLDASQNDFPGRLRQLVRLSGRPLSDALQTELDRARSIRHEIVHRGRRLEYFERGTAQRCVDTLRWIYNFLEDRDDLRRLRESRLALRSIGRHAVSHQFDAEITPSGVVVVAPGEEPSSGFE